MTPFVKPTLSKIAAFPLAALALGLVTMFFWPEGFSSGDDPETGSDFPRVAWREAEPHASAGDWLLVDAREEEHYRAEHIPGAVSLPAQCYPEMLEFFAEEHGKAKVVVVYCGSEDCDLSTELALRLRDDIGLTDVRILDGGFLAWKRASRTPQP